MAITGRRAIVWLIGLSLVSCASFAAQLPLAAAPSVRAAQQKMKCPKCGERFPVSAKTLRCLFCGYSLEKWPISDGDLQRLKQMNLIPANASPGKGMTEADLDVLVQGVKRYLASDNEVPIESTKTVVNRLRLLGALMKLALHPEDKNHLSELDMYYREFDPESRPPCERPVDIQPNSWAFPYAAAAIDRGWWPPECPVQPSNPATWSFAAAILKNMNLPDNPPDGANPIYTGLIINVCDLPIQRSPSCRVLADPFEGEKERTVVYPLDVVVQVDGREKRQCCVPRSVFQQDYGMVSYQMDVEDARRRAGKYPLIVWAVDLAMEPGLGDAPVVSSEDATRILEAEKRSNFLRRWNVCIVEQTSLFKPSDVKDIDRLALRLKNPADPVFMHLRTLLNDNTVALLSSASEDAPLTKELQKALADDLNRILQSGSLYNEDMFKGVKLRSATRKLLKADPQGKSAARLNRLLLQDALCEEFCRE